MRTRALLVAALVAAALPLPAVASPRPDAGAWARRYRALAHDLPLAPVPHPGPSAPPPWLFAAGDLDGDGAGDVADVRFTGVTDETTAEFRVTAHAEARRGRDGALLWSKQVAGTYPYVLGAKVGAAGRDGLVGVVYDDRSVYGMAGAGSLKVTAWDGAGAVVWTWSAPVAFTAAGSPTAGATTWVMGAGQLAPGAATDYLLLSSAHAGAFAPEAGWVSGQRLRLAVLDGSTGTVRDLGESPLADAGTLRPTLVGDVTGDGLDDVAGLVGEPGAYALHVVSSADGAEVYRVPGVRGDDLYRLTRSRDVTGDGVADFLVTTTAPNALRDTLVDGARGVARWTRPTAGSFVVGSGRGARVVVPSTLTRGRATEELHAVAYDAAGRVAWSLDRVTDLTGLEGGYGRDQWVEPAGDVNADGVEDVAFGLVVTPAKGAQRRDVGVVDGRTGRVTRYAATHLIPTSVAIDGRGADAYAYDVTRGVLTLTAWRGDAPRALWRTSLAMRASGPGRSFGTHLDRDRCGDVAVTVYGSETTTVVLSGRTGAPAWMLTRSGDAPSVLSRPAARVSRYARTC